MAGKLCRIQKFNSRQHYLRHKRTPTSTRALSKRGRSSMTPQERQLVDDLFDRLSKLESAPRDPDADRRDHARLAHGAQRGLRAGANGSGPGRSAQACQQPHPGTGSGKRARSRITPAGFSIRCAIPFSGKISRAARCRTCGLPTSAAVRSGTAAR